MQFDNVNFEIDSKINCDAFHSTRDDISEFGFIISSFTNFMMEFVRQQTNAVAHVLARETMFLASPTVYFNTPDCIESLIINEML